MRKALRANQCSAKADEDVHTHYQYVVGSSIPKRLLFGEDNRRGAEAGTCCSCTQKLPLSEILTHHPAPIMNAQLKV